MLMLDVKTMKEKNFNVSKNNAKNAIKEWQFPKAEYKGLLIPYCPTCKRQLSYTGSEGNYIACCEEGYYSRTVYQLCKCNTLVTYGD